MGTNAIRLLKFAIRYMDGWHSYAKDAKTTRAINTLVSHGFIEVNEHRQFRLLREKTA